MTIIKASHRQNGQSKPRTDRQIMLPAQERDLMREYLDTGNMTEAARRVGITRNRAMSALRSLAWLDELRRAYESAGLTAHHLGVTLRQALEANQQVVIRVSREEQAVVEYPDWGRRLKALDMVVNLHLALAAKAPADYEEEKPIERAVIVTPTEIAGMTRAQVLDLVRRKLHPEQPVEGAASSRDEAASG